MNSFGASVPPQPNTFRPFAFTAGTTENGLFTDAASANAVAKKAVAKKSNSSFKAAVAALSWLSTKDLAPRASLLDLLSENVDVFSDVDILAKGANGDVVAIPAVKILLASHSPYFKMFFEPNTAANVMRNGDVSGQRFQIDEKDTDEAVVRDVVNFVMTGSGSFDQALRDNSWLEDRFAFAARVQVNSYLVAIIDWVIRTSSSVLTFRLLRISLTNYCELCNWIFDNFLPNVVANKDLICAVTKAFYEELWERVFGGDLLTEKECKLVSGIITSSTALQSWILLKRSKFADMQPAASQLRTHASSVSIVDFCRLIVLLDEQERVELVTALGQMGNLNGVGN